MTSDSEAAMALWTKDNKDDPCVVCKSQRRGHDVCKKKQGHSVLDFPGTSLTQQHCKTYLDFKKVVFCGKEQLVLQRAQQAGGSTGVAVALDKLMGKTTAPVEVMDLTGGPNAPEMMYVGWECSLRQWPEDSDYELRMTEYCASEFANTMLVDKSKLYSSKAN